MAVTVAVIGGAAAPSGAQAPPAVIATQESVFSAPGLGSAVSTSEDVVLAGGTEVVHVYERESDSWAETTTLTASDGGPGDEFGAAVNLSGEFALVGAPGVTVDGHPGAGAAYVFRRVADGTWVQSARLVSASPADGAHFGASLDSSAELWLIIGEPGAGAATIFEPLEPGISWQVTAELPGPGLPPPDAIAAGFGTSVAIEVSFGFKLAVVGAPAGDGAGRVNAYLGGGPSWVGWWSLVDSPRVAGGRFGQTVAMESTALVVGAPGVDAIVGFDLDPNTGEVTPLGRDVGGAGFGSATAIGAARGIAGDPSVGAAYLYARGATGGALVGTLLPATGARHDGFGASVAVSSAAVVGAPGADAIHIFDLGTTDVLDHASIGLRGVSPYTRSGDVAGQVAVTRRQGRVVSVVAHGRVLTAAATPPPYLALDLRRIGASSRLAGSLTVRDPEQGVDRTLLVITTAQAANETLVVGNGIGLELVDGRPRIVPVRWSVDDLAT